MYFFIIICVVALFAFLVKKKEFFENGECQAVQQDWEARFKKQLVVENDLRQQMYEKEFVNEQCNAVQQKMDDLKTASDRANQEYTKQISILTDKYNKLIDSMNESLNAGADARSQMHQNQVT